MTTWVTADLHFGHKNILKFNPATRKYVDVHDMNTCMILEWNKKVHENDTVFLLGDVSFGNRDFTSNILKALKGFIVLVRGNHDTKLSDNQFNEAYHYLEVDVQSTKVCMLHYPMETWNQKERGSIHLHGHCHGMLENKITRRRDVGVDATGQVLLDLDEVVADMLAVPFTDRNGR